MNPHQRSIAAILSFTLFFIAPGCINLDPATDSTRFYVLNATIEPVTKAGRKHLLVRNVSLADYLQNSQIAQRDGSNKVTYNAGHRWAGSLDKMISEIVAEEISLSSPALFASTLATGREEIFLDLKVVQFDFSTAGSTTLVMEYVLADAQSQDQLRHERIRIQRDIAADADFEEIVNSLEQTLRAGVREIPLK